jgi:hypothetical protein
MTMTPNLAPVNSVIEYRYSSNTIWGDSDDIVIGTDTTTLGGGVLSGGENISFTIPNSSGTKYFLIKANSDNSIVETNYSNNISQITFVPIDPNIALADLSVQLSTPTSLNIVLTPTQISLNFRWVFTNTGTVPITSFSYERRWVNCTGGTFNFSCVSSTSRYELFFINKYLSTVNGNRI